MTIFVTNQNLNQMEHYLSVLEKSFKRNWNLPALCNYRGETFTCCDVAVSIAKFHIFFEAVGISKGDKIALCARNSARWAISFLSVNTYEAVAVPLLSDFHPESVAHLVDHSEAVMLFTDPEIWAKLDVSAMPMLKAVVSVRDFTLLYSRNDEIKSAFQHVPDYFAARFPMGYSRENVRFPVSNDKDLAVINYTSGTTSDPKGVMLRYECFSSIITFAVTEVPIYKGDNVVSMLPMGHIYGLVIEFLFPFCYGSTVYFLGKTPSPTLLLSAMKEVKPFMVIAVPLVMEKVYKSSIRPVIRKWYMRVLLAIPGIGHLLYRKIGKRLMAAFGNNVRYFIMGGAAMNPEVDRAFSRMGIPYTVGYGMTEAAPLLTFCRWREYEPSSCGMPVPSVEMKIDSEDPAHIAGEILVRGVNICSGYFKNPDATANSFNDDGFFRTGDLGIMDAKGNLFIKGRSKNMILSANGQNIYPEEIETVLNAQDYVGESLVVDRSGRLVALLYLDRDAIKRDQLDNEVVSDIPERVRIAANRMLPNYSQITKVEVVLEPFEKTPKMSIKRFLYK